MNSTSPRPQMEIVEPESVGISSERLKRVDELTTRYVKEGCYAGVVTLLSRDGKIAHTSAAGTFGIDNQQLLSTENLFRIYSMTKPITAIAAMILYEEGKFHIDDPVAKFLPEFAQQKVLVEGKRMEASSPMTIRQLLTHSAGLSYGWTDDPVDQEYRQAELFKSRNLDEFVSRLANLPLRNIPGARYYYSVAYDLLGAVIERLSGQTLNDFFRERIFSPLQMQETYFELPSDQRYRLPTDQVWSNRTNKIEVVPSERSRQYDQVSLYEGGGGLISSIGDYWRFSQMVINGGSLDGTRILGPKTIEFMSNDHLPPAVRAQCTGEAPIANLYGGQSMGLGYGVVTNPAWMPDISSCGELSWGGMAGTKFWIDPREKLIGIAMVQLYQSPWPLRFDLKSASYQALTELYSNRSPIT